MRIGANLLKGDKLDGDIITSAEFNELENVVKAGINANYDEIQNIKQVIAGNGNISLDISVYYFDGKVNDTNLQLINDICKKYDNNEPFVLFGRFRAEIVEGNPNAFIDTVVPIQVKNVTGLENIDNSNGYTGCFISSPIVCYDKLVYYALMLKGSWGEFTEFSIVKMLPNTPRQ